MAVEAGGLTNSPMLEQVFVNPDHSSQVLYQLSELWRDKKLCDATIEVGPVKVYVHRLVLLAACPYLLTVGGQHEVSILEVKLPMTVGLEGLNIFLTYLYDGVLHLTTANLRSVEKLAKILKVASIQKFCQEFRDANRETGAADKLTTDYSLKMTNSSLQIIFAEIQTGELKRESADLESDVVPIKRPRMNLDMLSAALQKKSSQSVPSDSFRDTNRGHSGVGATDELFHTDRHRGEGDSTIDTVTGLVRVKDEPVSDYEEEDDEDDDAGYGDEDSELQGYGTTTTDFVRQAPYDTRPFPDDGMNTSGSKMVVSLPPPPSLQKRPGRKRKQLPSGAQHTAQTSTSDADVSFTKGADASETEEGSVDATKVLKNIVKAMPEMAMNLGTSSEIGDDNKPRVVSPVYEVQVCHSPDMLDMSLDEIMLEDGQDPSDDDKTCTRKNVATSPTPPSLSASSPTKSNTDQTLTRTPAADTNSRSSRLVHGICSCDICDRMFSKVYTMKRHRMIHTGEGLFPCELCESKFRDRSKLRLHVAEKHEGLKYECEVCAKVFQHKNTFSHHKLKHKGAGKFLCDHCGRGFYDPVSLDGHVNTHKGLQPYKCKKCTKAFHHEGNKRRHERTCGDHKKDSDHMCEVCGQKFKAARYLKEHSNMHTRKRTYQCEHCDRVYFFRQSLRKHVIQAH